MAQRSTFRRRLAALAAIFSLGLTMPAESAASDLVFGPVTCQRGTGAPTVFSYSFAAAEPSRGFIFKVFNGGLEDTTYELVSASTVTLNGVEILGPSNFNQNVSYLEVPVSLQAENSLEVEVRGKPGGAMIVKLFPVVAIDAADGQVLGASTVAVTGHVYSSVTSLVINGVAAMVTGDTFSAPGVTLAEGANLITATATRADGFQGTDSVRVTLDSTAPTVTIDFPPEGLATNQDVVPVYAVADVLDPNPSVVVTPLPPYTAEGSHHVTVTATDWAGNQLGEPHLRHRRDSPRAQHPIP